MLSAAHSVRFPTHSGAGRMPALAVSNAEIAVATTAGFTSTQPARPCREAFSEVTLLADAAEPPPSQLAEVAAVLIADAMPEPWWVAPKVCQAVWLATCVPTPVPPLSSVSLASGVRDAQPGSGMRAHP